MEEDLTVLFLTVIAFLIGSIPTGMLVAKYYHVDLKKVGSGNIGATNVLRSIGKGAALFTLIGDIIKGMIPVLIAQQLDVGMYSEGLTGICAILGHNHSLFLKFKGGKGVATSIGVLIIFSPQTSIVTIIIWIMAALVSRYSSFGALAAFGLLPLSIWILDSDKKIPVAIVMTILIYIRHTGNILNLVRGRERKIGEKN